MLVLTRKTGQKLLIGNDIEVKVLETHGDSVKIGISAPRHVSIYREELYLEIKKANQQQAATPTDMSALDMAVSAANAAKASPKKPTS